MEEQNIFKRIGLPLVEVPPDLKELVLSDIEDAKTIMELATLFSMEFPKTGEEIFKRDQQNSTT
jgi:hypothetical protein